MCIRTTLPPIVEPEIATLLTWTLQFFVPFTLMEKYLEPLGEVTGQDMAGEFQQVRREQFTSPLGHLATIAGGKLPRARFVWRAAV